MGKVAIHYGWIPMILYIGKCPLPNSHDLSGSLALPSGMLIVGYTQSSPRPAAWKYKETPSNAYSRMIVPLGG